MDGPVGGEMGTNLLARRPGCQRAPLRSRIGERAGGATLRAAAAPALMSGPDYYILGGVACTDAPLRVTHPPRARRGHRWRRPGCTEPRVGCPVRGIFPPRGPANCNCSLFRRRPCVPPSFPPRSRCCSPAAVRLRSHRAGRHGASRSGAGARLSRAAARGGGHELLGHEGPAPTARYYVGGRRAERPALRRGWLR